MCSSFVNTIASIKAIIIANMIEDNSTIILNTNSLISPIPSKLTLKDIGSIIITNKTRKLTA